jgi:hypothetical protein
MNKQERLEQLMKLISECMLEGKVGFLANLIVNLENQYHELATLSTDGKYKEDWTHTKVLDYLTYANRV